MNYEFETRDITVSKFYRKGTKKAAANAAADKKYADRIRLAERRLGEHQGKNIHLNREQSNHVLEYDCPTCPMVYCHESTCNNGTEMLCKARSVDGQNVWVKIGNERPSVEVGKQYGFLIPMRRSEKRSGKAVYWDCVCSCREVVTVRGDNLLSGKTKSCGCGGMPYAGCHCDFAYELESTLNSELKLILDLFDAGEIDLDTRRMLEEDSLRNADTKILMHDASEHPRVVHELCNWINHSDNMAVGENTSN